MNSKLFHSNDFELLESTNIDAGQASALNRKRFVMVLSTATIHQTKKNRYA